MEKIKQLELEAEGLKAENHRLVSVIAPIGTAQRNQQRNTSKSSPTNQVEVTSLFSSYNKRPDTCEKGISVAGLRKLEEIAKRLCAEGRFAEDRTFDFFYPGTTDFSKLTTTQFVSMWG